MASNKKSTIFGALSLLPGVLLAQGITVEPADFGLSLEQLADIKVESASLVSTTLARAPAIVTVIGQDEMKTWGDANHKWRIFTAKRRHKLGTRAFGGNPLRAGLGKTARTPSKRPSKVRRRLIPVPANVIER